MLRYALTMLTVLILLPAAALAGDKKKDKKDKKAEDPRVTVEIPITGLRNDADAAYLRKILKQKLGTRAESDVAGREKVLLKVEQGCSVSMVDLVRVFDKVGRKRKCRLRMGDPQLRGRVELATKIKRPHPTRVKALMGKLKQLKGVKPERENSKSVKRIPIEVSSEQIRLGAVRTVFAKSLGLRDRGLFRDVIWHGPPGGNRGAGKGGTDPGTGPKWEHYKKSKAYKERMVLFSGK